MEDPRIISALFISLKMAYYNVLINIQRAPSLLQDEGEKPTKEDAVGDSGGM